MCVLKWSMGFTPVEESPISPVWVGLLGLPIHLFDKTVLFSIARLLGSPLKVDETTTKKMRPACARICVELDLTQKWVEEIWIGKDNRGFAQKIKYESLLKFCLGCRHIGHDQESCYATGKGKPKQSKDVDPPVDLRNLLDKKRGKRVGIDEGNEEDKVEDLAAQ